MVLLNRYTIEDMDELANCKGFELVESFEGVHQHGFWLRISEDVLHEMQMREVLDDEV